MIKIYTETAFFDKFNQNSAFIAPQLTVILILNGEITFEVNDICNTYCKNSLVFISPKNVYKAMGHSADLRMFIAVINREEIRTNIDFTYNRMAFYTLAKMDLLHKGLNLNDMQFEALSSLFQQIFNLQNAPSEIYFKQAVIKHLTTAISYITAGLVLEETGKKPEKRDRMEEITISFMTLVDEHFKTERNLEFYASELHISVKYLSNSVRKIAGVPPTEILSDALATEAKTILLNSSKTSSEIAYLLGFSDQYTFAKFFKKQAGLSPKFFRQMNSISNMG